MAETYLAQAVEAADGAGTYDTYARALLADKQILAWILKYAVVEFHDMEIGEIVACIGDDIEVGTRPVDPGLSNLGRVHGSSTEDDVPGEGKIYYDIRFTAYHRGMKMKFLINVEPQKSSDPSKLGYHLENRMVFYLTRMVSAQKMTEFFHSDFDQLKNVRSIWICMDQEEEGNSMEEICLVRRTVFGKETKSSEIGLMKGIIIHLRDGDIQEKSSNPLVAMLETLFSQESVEKKKYTLTEEYGMVMTAPLEGGIQNMCNWSENMIERGVRKGREEGRKVGREEGIEIFILDNMEEQVPATRILEKLQRRFQLDEAKARSYFERFAYAKQ